jgi:pyruvate kinase
VKLPDNKTKIVATLGPASADERTLSSMARAGLSVVRLNMSHGSLESHAQNIRLVRRVSERLKKPLAILMDLPGPKIRLGKLIKEPAVLKRGDEVVFTTRSHEAAEGILPVDFKPLSKCVKPDGYIYLNDGFIQLKVIWVRGHQVKCRVLVGGQTRSRKGMNLPGARVLSDAVTKEDLKFVDFGLKHGVNIFGVSFVADAEDIRRLKRFAAGRGKMVYTVAKIERPEAVARLDGILEETDAVMVARGDLGVEIPIHQVPVVQKEIIRKANIAGRPVVTATQMLLSMVDSIRPTRAEAADVANAIMDGTDAVMLSEETALGKYPVRAVAMMAAIAKNVEGHREQSLSASEVEEALLSGKGPGGLAAEDAVSLAAVQLQESLGIGCLLAPTRTGSTPRRISRFKPRAWVLGFSDGPGVREFMQFSYGVHPSVLPGLKPGGVRAMMKEAVELRAAQSGGKMLLIEGSSQGMTDTLRVIGP